MKSISYIYFLEIFVGLLGAFWGNACVPEVSEVGKHCDLEHACGDDLQCCEGTCQTMCSPCPERICNLDWAVDCEAHRICQQGCWEPCPSCAQRCADPNFRDCQSELPSGESWRCRQGEVCVMHVSSLQHSAACYPASPMCASPEDATCDCMVTRLASSPYPSACSSGETCNNVNPGTINCQIPTPPDAGPCCDAGVSHRDASSFDAHSRDAGVLDSGALVDASSAWDSSPWDAGVVTSDAASIVDSGEQDASGLHDGGLDGGGFDSSVFDAGLYDSGRPDSTTTDSGPVSPCGAPAPDCFAGLGTSPFGELCCAETGVAAQCIESSLPYWRCPAGSDFATRCEGYGQVCVDGLSPSCDPALGCLWSWEDQGQLRCASFGPIAPCVDNQWRCVSASSAAPSCDCIDTACP